MKTTSAETGRMPAWLAHNRLVAEWARSMAAMTGHGYNRVPVWVSERLAEQAKR